MTAEELIENLMDGSRVWLACRAAGDCGLNPNHIKYNNADDTDGLFEQWLRGETVWVY